MKNKFVALLRLLVFLGLNSQAEAMHRPAGTFVPELCTDSGATLSTVAVRQVCLGHLAVTKQPAIILIFNERSSRVYEIQYKGHPENGMIRGWALWEFTGCAPHCNKDRIYGTLTAEVKLKNPTTSTETYEISLKTQESGLSFKGPMGLVLVEE